MRPDHWWDISVIRPILCCRADRDEVEHLCRVLSTKANIEAVRLLKVVCKLLQTFLRARITSVSREDKKLETNVGRKHILNVERLCVGRADEDVWEHALANDEVRSEVLILGVGDC